MAFTAVAMLAGCVPTRMNTPSAVPPPELRVGLEPGIPAEALGATHVRRESVDRAGVEAIQSEARQGLETRHARLGHARHVHPGVVARLPESVDPLPELGQRGQSR